MKCSVSPELTRIEADLQGPSHAWARPCSGTQNIPFLPARSAQHVRGQDHGKAAPQGMQLWISRHSKGFRSAQPLSGRHRLCMWKQKSLAEISPGGADDLVSSILLSSRCLEGNKPPCSTALKCWTSAPSPQCLELQKAELTENTNQVHCTSHRFAGRPGPYDSE